MAYDYVMAVTDGAGTVTLTSSPFDLNEYMQRTGGLEAETVGESIELRLMDGSAVNNLEEADALERLLVQAEQAQSNRALNKVYLTFKRSAASSVYRSEIRTGRVEWNATAYNRAYWDHSTQFARVYIERVNYWEGPEAQIPLTNPNGTNNTSGLRVFNCNDGSGSSPNIRRNYVDVAGTAVLGVLPAATRLEMTNSYNHAYPLREVWIGSNYVNTGHVHNLEAEAATGGSVFSSASASGGEYKACTFSVINTATTLLTWSLSSADLNAAAGQYFKFLVRFFNSSGWTGTRLWVEIRDSDNNILWTSPTANVSVGSGILIRDMMVMRLPPWLAGLGGLKSLSMLLRGQCETAPTTINIDFIQLLSTNGWQYLTKGRCPYTYRIIDDGLDDRLYIDDGSGTNRVGTEVSEGGAPIMLYPGKNQRMYFLQHTSYFLECHIVQQMTVKLYYRPRRRTP